MRSMLQLRKVRLVNWHNFTDETIEVEGSLFLIGDNGSGKTTLLDAVHCALTGDWKVELNAAARVGGRRGEGRNLQGLVLGHDVERGYRRPNGAVAYAALEFADPGSNGSGQRGAVVSIGIGVYVATPDSQAERWGFVTPVPLADVPLTRPAGGDGGDADSAGRRPSDRAELAAALPQGHVLDIGRYRTRVGERLFESRGHLEQVATFLQAGKAYRELVGKTANFSQLFSELLPQPDLETFHEVRRALEAIERTRGDLDGLELELARLRDLIFWLQEVTAERETIARDDYIAASHTRDEARGHVEQWSARHAAAGEELTATESTRAAQVDLLEALEAELSRLRGDGGLEMVERHREVGRQLERVRGVVDSLVEELERLSQAETRCTAEREQCLARLAAWSHEVSSRLRELMIGLEEVGPELELKAARAFQERLAGLRADAVTLAEEIAAANEDRRRLRHELDRLAAGCFERRSAARREAAAALRELREHRRRMGVLRERGESDPPLPGLDEALALLRADGIAAAPLYRLLEPHDGLSAEEAGVIERALGRKLLGTLIVAPEDHARALSLVLAKLPGIPIADATTAADRLAAAQPTVCELIEITGSDPVAAAYLRHHAGELRWQRSAEADQDGPFLTAAGHLRSAQRQMCIPAGRAVWLGARARRRAWREEMDGLAHAVDRARERAEIQRGTAEREARIARRLTEAARFVEALDLIGSSAIVHRRDELAREGERLGADLAARERERLQAVRDADLLEHEHQILAETVQSRGLERLAARVRELEAQRTRRRSELDVLSEELGRCRERRTVLANRLAEARDQAEQRETVVQAARATLTVLVPEAHRGDLDDYVMRVRRGRQIKTENLASHREDAVRKIAALQERITQGEGIRKPELWQKYAFRYDETANALRDNAGKEVEAITEELQAQVDELNEALRGRNEELLERIVLQELVGALRRETDHLHTTVQGVNQLMGDLTFGRSRYRIEQRLKPEMSKLTRLLRESSGLSSGSREELRDYFAARLDEFNDPTGERLPAVLDYRQWYEFHLRMSTLDDAGVELSQERLRQGSGGEQAVPAYLLLFCLTKLLYDGIDARARILLLDEAFYGIDAGRRNELLRFCGRAGIDLVVATPEVDGVTEALPSSTTVLIEKTPEADVFLFDLRYRQTAPTLFDAGGPTPEDLVLGIREGEHGGLQ